jgi:hypothetical protein
MRKLMDKLKMEDEKLNLELSHGDANKMKGVLERKINLYNCFLKESDLGDLDRLSLENKRECALCHHKRECTDRILAENTTGTE